MELPTQGQEIDGGSDQLRLRSVPDTCPRCHQGIHAKFIFAAALTERNCAHAVFRCPRVACQGLFLAEYQYGGRSGQHMICTLVAVAPRSPQGAAHSERVVATSPTFVQIYDQVLAAEASGLDQMVGIGLRKALEFLIKDFCASENPVDGERIRAMPLGHCINELVSDPNIKQCAHRAAWLGNDETHYTRKWVEKDVHDLKVLVRLTSNWIDSALLTREYASAMPEPKK